MEQEGENEALKRIKIDEEIEDRISDLQYCLLLDILSRLNSLEEAIRTGTLSKRWIHLWTQLPNLSFIHKYGKHSMYDFYPMVEKTLTQCCPRSNLNKFRFKCFLVGQYVPEVVDWICYAISRNVQEIDLSFHDRLFSSDYAFQFDKFFPIDSCFTCLKLECCSLYTTSAISWNKLTSLSLSKQLLYEKDIQKILSGCPLLETFELNECSGYGLIDITSKSVKNLVFSRYVNRDDYPIQFADTVEINAPHILSLTIENSLWLCKLDLLNVSSLVDANLDYSKGGFDATHKEEAEDMLKGFIANLRHVKELKIGYYRLEVLIRLKAKGFIFPSCLKCPDVDPLSYFGRGLLSDSDSVSYGDSGESRDLSDG